MSWMKRKVYNWALKNATKDLNSTLLILKGQDDIEVAMIVASALTLRINLRRGGQPLDDALDPGSGMSEMERDFYLPQLIKMHNVFVKEDMLASAAGVKVWLHSLRAMIYPELRVLGREMWGATISRVRRCRGVLLCCQ